MTRLAALLRLALQLALAGWLGQGCLNTALAREAHAPATAAPVAAADLPFEARQTLQLIKRGGPFPYPGKDGSIFGNFERRLPPQPRGYYREYTVPTPGRSDRGARRIVAGQGPGRNVANSGEYYYSPDHYRSFYRIREP